MPTSADASESEKIIAEIKEKRWWQGSLILGSSLSTVVKSCGQEEWWIITSQTCNLYNSSFQNVPVFEVVAAREIEKCDPGKIRGDNPRILHVEAQTENEKIALEINIQTRQWCPRQALSKLPTPTFNVRDAGRGVDTDWAKKQWLDNFVGWLARSYNRIALPDAFNEAMHKSKLRDVFEKKLAKKKDELYGIYFSLEADSEKPWDGIIGKMPPPYLLSIVLVSYEDADPDFLKTKLLKSLFEDKVKDPGNASDKISRAQLARRYGIRLIEADIDAMSVAEITLARLKSLVRYSFVDHLSDSSMAAP